MRIAVTGAAGYLGRLVVEKLAERGHQVVATDVRESPALAGVERRVLDIRDPDLAEVFAGADAVVHLAAVVTPPPGASREWLHEVEVGGTENVLRCCVAAGVKQLVYTSSGAAYGYSALNKPLLDESDPLRGDEVFAYSWHKRLVEELLQRYRSEHPDLDQLVFRVSTILGPSVSNQITALFEGRVVVGIQGVDTPFCFAWDGDVVGAIVAGIEARSAGIYNLTGDGVMTLREVASAMGGRYVGVPEGLLRRGLGSLRKRGWTRHGPDELGFLRHRPVLSNARLKTELGYVPQKSSREVFELYRRSRGR